MMFAVVFGLSMDYEVFLISRIHEEWVRRGRLRGRRRGIALTGRVITAAAAIMVCVFLSFTLGNERTLKEFGLGLAVAVFLDALIVRCLLLPSCSSCSDRVTWRLPRWLDARMPHFNIEGSVVRPPVADGRHRHRRLRSRPRRAGGAVTGNHEAAVAGAVVSAEWARRPRPQRARTGSSAGGSGTTRAGRRWRRPTGPPRGACEAADADRPSVPEHRRRRRANGVADANRLRAAADGSLRRPARYRPGHTGAGGAAGVEADPISHRSVGTSPREMAGR